MPRAATLLVRVAADPSDGHGLAADRHDEIPDPQLLDTYLPVRGQDACALEEAVPATAVLGPAVVVPLLPFLNQPLWFPLLPFLASAADDRRVVARAAVATTLPLAAAATPRK
jgi:hypothetical protein